MNYNEQDFLSGFCAGRSMHGLFPAMKGKFKEYELLDFAKLLKGSEIRIPNLNCYRTTIFTYMKLKKIEDFNVVWDMVIHSQSGMFSTTMDWTDKYGPPAIPLGYMLPPSFAFPGITTGSQFLSMPKLDTVYTGAFDYAQPGDPPYKDPTPWIKDRNVIVKEIDRSNVILLEDDEQRAYRFNDERMYVILLEGRGWRNIATTIDFKLGYEVSTPIVI